MSNRPERPMRMSGRDAGINPDVLRLAQVLWDYHCIFDPEKRVDAIVGLGSYDTRVAERCAELFHKGLARKIIFTGSQGNWTRGLFDRSEAATFAAVAIRLGVPADAIFLEERATNIGENIRFVAEFLDQSASVMFVTKPQTQRRCRATVSRQWPACAALVTAPEHGLLAQPTEFMPMHDLVCEMVGDIRRMETYPELGFQAHEDIPADVKSVYCDLVRAGFVDHLPAGPGR